MFLLPILGNSWAGVLGKGIPTHRVDLGYHGNIPLPSLFSLQHPSPHRGSILCPTTHTTVPYYRLLQAEVIPVSLYYPDPSCRIQLLYPVDTTSTSQQKLSQPPRQHVDVISLCVCVGWADGPPRAVNPGRSRLQERSTSGAIDCQGILHVEPRLSSASSPNSTPLTPKRKNNRLPSSNY